MNHAPVTFVARQHNEKRTALSGHTLHPDAAAVDLRQGLHHRHNHRDGKKQSGDLTCAQPEESVNQPFQCTTQTAWRIFRPAVFPPHNPQAG